MSTDSAFCSRIALAGFLSLLFSFASAESWARPKKSAPPKAKRCQRTEDCNERDGCRYCNKRTRRCDWLPNCCHKKRPCKTASGFLDLLEPLGYSMSHQLAHHVE